MAEPPKKGAKRAGDRDPMTGCYVRGHPGGPGRPQGSRNAATLALEKIMADGAEDVVRAMLTAAREGDVQAGKAILDRVVPVRRGRPTPLDLPPVATANGVLQALAAVVAAMSRGEVSPDEAAVIAGVVAAPRTVLEAAEFERRLAAIEARLARGPVPQEPEHEGGGP